MIVTNLKIIIARGWTDKDFKALMKRLSDKAKKELDGVTANAFPIVKEPYLHAENKCDIPLGALQELFRSEDIAIELRAIGEEVIKLPGKAFRDVQVPLTTEQKEEIGTAMCQTQEEIQNIEADKKEHSKTCATKIESCEKRMIDLVGRFRRGFDEKTIPCQIELDFVVGMKNYINEQTGEIIASEELQPKDYQMKIDWIPGVTEEQPSQEGVTGEPVTEPAAETSEPSEDLPFETADEKEDDLPM